ncbi:hypothetical protein AWENTII_003360 [Aspergillus wentii]
MVNKDKPMTWLLVPSPQGTGKHPLELFLSGISTEAQKLFRKEKWSEKDFTLLPKAADDDQQGIYYNFATGVDESCDAYVGSAYRAYSLTKRIACHLQIAKAKVLPKEDERIFH